LLLLSLLLPLSGCINSQAPEPIRLGQLVPLSGAGRMLGEHARLGVRLAMDENARADRRILGRPLVMLHVDTQSTADATRAETVRLLTVNRVVGLVASPDGGEARTIVRAAQPLGVTVVVPGDLPGDQLPESVGTLGVAPAQRGRALAQLVKERKFAPLAVVTDTGDEWAVEAAEAFSREVRKEPTASLREWSFEDNADKVAWLDEIAGYKPGAVLIAASVKNFASLRKSLGNAGVKVPLLYAGADVGVDAVQKVREDAEVYLATVCLREGLSEKGKEFAKRYEEANREPPDFAALQSYDAARLLIEALAASTASNAPRVKEYLAALTKFDSVTGPLTVKNRRANRKLFVVGLKEAPAILRTIEPEAATEEGKKS
jgi:ABC-type branched-subunit amino acid transport system substrate-binding protein